MNNQVDFVAGLYPEAYVDAPWGHWGHSTILKRCRSLWYTLAIIAAIAIVAAAALYVFSKGA